MYKEKIKMVKFNKENNTLQIPNGKKVEIHPAPLNLHYMTIINYNGVLCFEYLGKPVPLESIYAILLPKMLNGKSLPKLLNKNLMPKK